MSINKKNPHWIDKQAHTLEKVGRENACRGESLKLETLKTPTRTHPETKHDTKYSMFMQMWQATFTADNFAAIGSWYRLCITTNEKKTSTKSEARKNKIP